MQAKIIKVLTTDVYNGTSKTTGRQYTITTALCECTIDGVHMPAAPIKAMGEAAKKITEGAELSVEKKEWQGKVSYDVIRDASPASSGGWQKKPYTPAPKISWADYEKLCTAAWGLSKKLSAEHAPDLFDKILGCATVVIDFSGAAKKTEHAPAAPLVPQPAKIQPATEKTTLPMSGADPWENATDELEF